MSPLVLSQARGLGLGCVQFERSSQSVHALRKRFMTLVSACLKALFSGRTRYRRLSIICLARYRIGGRGRVEMGACQGDQGARWAHPRARGWRGVGEVEIPQAMHLGTYLLTLTYSIQYLQTLQLFPTTYKPYSCSRAAAASLRVLGVQNIR